MAIENTTAKLAGVSTGRGTGNNVGSFSYRGIRSYGKFNNGINRGFDILCAGFAAIKNATTAIINLGTPISESSATSFTHSIDITGISNSYSNVYEALDILTGFDDALNCDLELLWIPTAYDLSAASAGGKKTFTHVNGHTGQGNPIEHCIEEFGATSRRR
jgi:hypothetical protein